jgi:hypothetical protein
LGGRLPLLPLPLLRRLFCASQLLRVCQCLLHGSLALPQLLFKLFHLLLTQRQLGAQLAGLHRTCSLLGDLLLELCTFLHYANALLQALYLSHRCLLLQRRSPPTALCGSHGCLCLLHPAGQQAAMADPNRGHGSASTVALYDACMLHSMHSARRPRH